MRDEWPLVKDLVLVGGGHAHALLLRMWAMKPLAGVRVTVINPNPVAPYTGMLPGMIAGHYTQAQIMIDLVQLARHAGARVVLGRAVGIDRTARRVILSNGPPIAYDIASIDIGIGSELPEIPGYAAHGVAAKPLGDYARRWEAFVAAGRPAPQVVIIGAGVGGAELAMASAHRLRAAGANPTVTLLERADTALPHIGAGARRALLAALTRNGVTLQTGAEVTAIHADHVALADGRRVPSEFTLAVAGSRPQGWLTEIGVDTHQGFVTVGPTLQSLDPAIFAAGDCAHLSHAPRPKAGVFAVREAPFLYHNLRVALRGQGRMRAYHPQRDYLKLVSLGGKRAVADKLGLRLEGGWLWRWKDRIDRRFMAMFGNYPAMPAPALPAIRAEGLEEAMGDKPMCGACGAKVAASDLGAALAALPRPHRADVLRGAGDDAAILAQGDGVQVISTDHLRAFVPDPALMARVAAVHALGDVWAMGAAPQAALATVTLPKAAPRLQAETLREVMAAAGAVFAEAGADVVGGHSSVGAELQVGFTVTGLARRALSKGGARAGDVLILTKPLGVGTVLAAEMAQVVPDGLMLGEVWAACIAQMLRPMTLDAAALAPVAHAMTDVTGFGLAGHLLEICEASGVAAEVSLSALPILRGAESLAGKGVASTIAPGNRAACLGRVRLVDHPRAALVFDPQTCGGLLAAVPQEAAEAILASLTRSGVPATRIGRVLEGAPFLSIIA